MQPVGVCQTDTLFCASVPWKHDFISFPLSKSCLCCQRRCQDTRYCVETRAAEGYSLFLVILMGLCEPLSYLLGMVRELHALLCNTDTIHSWTWSWRTGISFERDTSFSGADHFMEKNHSINLTKSKFNTFHYIKAYDVHDYSTSRPPLLTSFPQKSHISVSKRWFKDDYWQTQRWSKTS